MIIKLKLPSTSVQTKIDNCAVTIQILRRTSYRANPLAYAWIDGHNRYTIRLREAYNPQGSFGGGVAGWKATVEIDGRTFEVLEDTQRQAVETICCNIIKSRAT